MAGETPEVQSLNGENHDERRGLAHLFRSLDSRNYRLFFAGQLVSLIGTWLTNVATSWLVNRITNSPVMLGVVNFAALVPAFCLTLFAGVLVDRWNKHRLLVLTQTLSMLQSFGLAALSFLVVGFGRQPSPATVSVAIVGLIGLAMFQGLVNAFDVPGRQSFVVQMVQRREDLPNAIALNSSMFNLARLIGPAVAGLLIYAVGEGWCFTLDGISYLAVIAALLMMRVTPPPKSEARRRVMEELKDGIRYARGMKSIRAILFHLAIVSFATTPYMILMPRFTTVVLHGDSRTQGLLTAAIAAGALLAALRLAARKTVVGLGRIIPIAGAGLGIAMMAFGLSTELWLSAVALVVVGFCTMSQMAAGNTLLQTLVEDHMRGRVMGLFTMSFMGMMPVGSLASGFLAANVGAPWTTVMGGGVCLLGAAIFAARLPAIRREVRPIYIQRGILPAVGGLQAVDTVVEEAER